MHVVSLLKSQMFDVRVDGKTAATSDIFPDWHAHDRFGLVIDEPFGGIGATHLLQLAMTCSTISSPAAAPRLRSIRKSMHFISARAMEPMRPMISGRRGAKSFSPTITAKFSMPSTIAASPGSPSPSGSQGRLRIVPRKLTQPSIASSRLSSIVRTAGSAMAMW